MKLINLSSMPTEQLLEGLPEHAKDFPPLYTLTDEQLARWTEYVRRNAGPGQLGTYDYALINKVLPELLRRFAFQIDSIVFTATAGFAAGVIKGLVDTGRELERERTKPKPKRRLKKGGGVMASDHPFEASFAFSWYPSAVAFRDAVNGATEHAQDGFHIKAPPGCVLRAYIMSRVPDRITDKWRWSVHVYSEKVKQ